MNKVWGQAYEGPAQCNVLHTKGLPYAMCWMSGSVLLYLWWGETNTLVLHLFHTAAESNATACASLLLMRHLVVHLQARACSACWRQQRRSVAHQLCNFVSSDAQMYDCCWAALDTFLHCNAQLLDRAPAWSSGMLVLYAP